MTSQELAALVKQCAVTSIHDALVAVAKLRYDYKTRIEMRRVRVQSCKTTIATFPKGEFTASLNMAATHLDLVLGRFSNEVSAYAQAWRAHLIALPDILVFQLVSLNLTVPASLSSATVCSKVNDALRPDLGMVSDELIKGRAYFDQEVALIDQHVLALEAALRNARTRFAISQ